MDVLTDTDLQELAAIVGAENVSTRGPDLEAHAVDSPAFPHQPEVIVWPSTTEEVAAILRYANARRIPVSPWSGGSSLEGTPCPWRAASSSDVPHDRCWRCARTICRSWSSRRHLR